jgi:hypothetical protein
MTPPKSIHVLSPLAAACLLAWVSNAQVQDQGLQDAPTAPTTTNNGVTTLQSVVITGNPRDDFFSNGSKGNFVSGTS